MSWTWRQVPFTWTPVFLVEHRSSSSAPGRCCCRRWCDPLCRHSGDSGGAMKWMSASYAAILLFKAQVVITFVHRFWAMNVPIDTGMILKDNWDQLEQVGMFLSATSSLHPVSAPCFSVTIFFGSACEKAKCQLHAASAAGWILLHSVVGFGSKSLAALTPSRGY